jgi:hypothetical protein
MQSGDGALAFFRRAHGDEAEAAGASGFAIHDQVGVRDGSLLGKEGGQVLLGGLEGEISYVQFHTFFRVTISRRQVKSARQARMNGTFGSGRERKTIPQTLLLASEGSGKIDKRTLAGLSGM